ncbi:MULTISPECIES: hypothetical protein [Agrobacterium]|uniref:hypothetical protein n=1 Tax=Agrobacterium TaxID=357 RepID=UPI003BA15C88
MSSYHEDDIISPRETSNAGVVRAERVWQHRHDLEIQPIPKPRFNRLTSLALGVSSLVLGTICMFAYSDLGPTHVTVPEKAMVSYPGGPETVSVPTALRDIVDAAPLLKPVSKTQFASQPYTVIPTKRPVIEPVKSGRVEKVNYAAATKNSIQVTRYDRCDPACDTRDPLVVGSISPGGHAMPSAIAAEKTDAERPSQAVEIGAAMVNGAGFVLVQTAALPFTTLKFGRDAARGMAKLD